MRKDKFSNFSNIFIFALFILMILFTNPSSSFASESCEEFQIGSGKIFKHNNFIRSVQFSLDGTKVATTSENTAKILDIKTGEEKIIKHNNLVNSVRFSPDSTKVITASYDGTAKISDINSGNEQIIRHNDWVNSAQFSPDGTKIITASSDTTSKIFDLNTGEELIIKHDKRIKSAQFSPDGNKVITTSENTAKILDLNTGEEKIIKHHNSYIRIAQFSSDSTEVIIALSEGLVKIFDLKTNKEKIIKHYDWIGSAQLSSDGTKVVMVSGCYAVKILDLKTSEEQIIKHYACVNSAEPSSDGTKVITGSGEGVLKIYDLKTSKEQINKNYGTIRKAQFSPDGTKVITASVDGTAKILDLKSTCSSNSMKFILDEKFEPCSDLKSGAANGSSGKSLLLSLVEGQCGEDFKNESWDPFTNIPSNDRLSPEQAEIFLMRFSKPGGFDPEKHLPVLLAILKSEFVQTKPSLVHSAMTGVLHSSNLLYDELIWKFPKLLKPIDPSQERESCISKTESDILQNTAKKYLTYLKNKNGTKTVFNNWTNLVPLKSTLRGLTPEEKAPNIGYIAQSLADKAVDSQEFKDLFHSKVLKFTANAVKSLFGDNPSLLTDLTIVRTAGSAQAIILGSKPIVKNGSFGATDAIYGFYAKSTPAINIPSDTKPNDILINETLEWTQGNEKFSANYEIKVGEKGNFVPKSDAPNYKELWDDNKLSGVVITGSNLGSSESAVTMDEYLAYYRTRGYEFKNEKQKIPNLPEWLGKQSSSGEMDYLIKEAHSDGDEKNIFRMDKEAFLLKGERKLPDGKIEEVKLIFPAQGNSETVLLSNQEFGSWIREREKAGKGELVYFNTSCWSKTKAVHELEATQSTKFVNIPSLTSVRVFRNQEQDAEQQMLNSFLDGKNYKEMRTAMTKNEDYKKRTENVLIFPDEDDYDRHIRKVVATPLDTKIDIRDGKGNPYSLESAAHH